MERRDETNHKRQRQMRGLIANAMRRGEGQMEGNRQNEAEQASEVREEEEFEA